MRAPVILFGAFDRHNFGDLLLGEVAAAGLPGREWVHAGLAERDLSEYGGRRVVALRALAGQWQGPPPWLVHVGGEVLTTTAWQAAAMLLPPTQARATIDYLEARPDERQEWVRAQLGTSALAPYAAGRRLLPQAARVDYHAVGGSALADAPAELQAEVLAALRGADSLTVRDHRTQAALAEHGMQVPCVPDPAASAATLFGARIRAAGASPALRPLREALGAVPGYLAVQLNAEYGDDATLDTIAAQLRLLCARTGLGVALFCAGLAPWHDEPALLHRLATRLAPARVALLDSAELWSICALIAGSAGFCGSSLHGRIVATAFARPRLSLVQRPGRDPKVQAYVDTWELPGLPGTAYPPQLADAMQAALAAAPSRLQRHADTLAARHAEALAQLFHGGR